MRQQFHLSLIEPCKPLYMKMPCQLCADSNVWTEPTNPNVPSPSFPKNSKSRMFEHPWKRGWPSSYRSRDGRCDDGDDSEAIFALEGISK